jgi:hypothetical protein
VLTTVILAASSGREALPSASMLTTRHVPTSVCESPAAATAGSRCAQAAPATVSPIANNPAMTRRCMAMLL